MFVVIVATFHNSRIMCSEFDSRTTNINDIIIVSYVQSLDGLIYIIYRLIHLSDTHSLPPHLSLHWGEVDMDRVVLGWVLYLRGADY